MYQSQDLAKLFPQFLRSLLPRIVPPLKRHSNALLLDAAILGKTRRNARHSYFLF
jgi:hypothetical protein